VLDLTVCSYTYHTQLQPFSLQRTVSATPTMSHSVSDHDLEDAGERSNNEKPLPPVDGGKDAWCFLFAIFVLEAVIWGLCVVPVIVRHASQLLMSNRPYSFGVFQEYYSAHPLFANSTGISAIGSTTLGLMYLPAPLLSLALQRWPRVRLPFMISGLALVIVALIAASFCSTVPGLIGTQGVLYAVGSIIFYFPGMQILDEWFVKRRATAFATVWAGAPLGGVVFPFVTQWLLDSYGFRTALRVYAIAFVSL